MIDGVLVVFFIAFCFLFYVLMFLVERVYQELVEKNLVAEKHRQSKVDAIGGHKSSRIFLSLIFGLVGGLLGLYILGGAGILIGFTGLGLGGYLFFSIREARKREKIEKQISGALSLIANTMRPGKTLPQAVESVSTTIEKPISEELSIIAREMLVGVRPDIALRHFRERIDTPDVKLAVKSMVVSMKTGANLPRALDKIVETITSRERLQGKIRVLTAQGKFQGILMAGIPWVILLVMYIFMPEYIQPLLTTLLGRVMLGVVVTLDLIAYVIIRTILTVKL